MTLKEFRQVGMRTFILQALDRNRWNIKQTAISIQTPRSNLYKLMSQHAINRGSMEASRWSA